MILLERATVGRATGQIDESAGRRIALMLFIASPARDRSVVPQRARELVSGPHLPKRACGRVLAADVSAPIVPTSVSLSSVPVTVWPSGAEPSGS